MAGETIVEVCIFVDKFLLWAIYASQFNGFVIILRLQLAFEDQILADYMIEMRSLALMPHFFRALHWMRYSYWFPILIQLFDLNSCGLLLNNIKLFVCAFKSFWVAIWVFSVIKALGREDDFLEDHELLTAIFACLVMQVIVLIGVHQTQPLL